MSVQLESQVEVTVTAANAAQYVEEGFRFARNVPAEDLVAVLDSYVERLGFGAVLVGEVVKLCDGLPWEGHHDGTLFSLFTKEPAVPGQRRR